jgi:hypothetical protein
VPKLRPAVAVYGPRQVRAVLGQPGATGVGSRLARRCAMTEITGVGSGHPRDRTGQAYGRLTVVERAPNGGTGRLTYTNWLCRCACGNLVTARGSCLQSGATKSCGCLNREVKARLCRARLVDLTGRTFGRLTVVERGPNSTRDDVRWLCRCACGAAKLVPAADLRSGHTTSCGCYSRERSGAQIGAFNRTHGQASSGAARPGTPTYSSWMAMKERTGNPNHVAYLRYGGRGITVCTEWQHSFERFHRDMGDRPEGMTLHRLNGDLGYFPDNVAWATAAEQAAEAWLRRAAPPPPVPCPFCHATAGTRCVTGKGRPLCKTFTHRPRLRLAAARSTAA